MATWDEAESTFLLAAAKTYAAMAIANPSGSYSSSLFVTLNIDGLEYQCRCDCTGVIQTIIRVMGYDPNWGQSSVPGHEGDAWYLADATGPFVKDKQGNISSDWEVLDFDANDCRPGDIRAASSHSHCDIFVAYKNNDAYGLNSGAVNAILDSSAAGTKYLQDNNEDDLAATWTIQDSDTAKTLRYVRGSDQPSSGNNVIANAGNSLKSLDVELKFISRLTFEYRLMTNLGSYRQKIPGYFPDVALYPTTGGTHANDLYGDSWLHFIPTYYYRWTDSEQDAEWRAAIRAGLIMLYTLDNSDPLQFGRTAYLHDDGTNDYERSKGLVPLIRTQFPVHFRGVLVDSDTREIVYGRTSAWFTNSTAEDSYANLDNLLKAARNSQFISDASGNSPEAGDAHGYLFINDEQTTYDRSEYTTWVQGIEEE